MKLAEYRKLNNPLSHCSIRIGIDAGKYTGIAIYYHEDSEWELQTMDFWEAYDRVASFNPYHTGIAVEVPRGHVVHASVEGKATGFGRDRHAANIGSNRREAELLAIGFERLGFPVVRVNPTTAKWDAKELERQTGIARKTNAHVRDAVRAIHQFT